MPAYLRQDLQYESQPVVLPSSQPLSYTHGTTRFLSDNSHDRGTGIHFEEVRYPSHRNKARCSGHSCSRYLHKVQSFFHLLSHPSGLLTREELHAPCGLPRGEFHIPVGSPHPDSDKMCRYIRLRLQSFHPIHHQRQCQPASGFPLSSP